MITYKPYDKRRLDLQYQNLLNKIIFEGRRREPINARLPENRGSRHQCSLELTGEILSFEMSNGFPLITCRDLWKSFFGAIGEIVAFLNGAETMEQLVEFGCPKVFWERWVCDPSKSAGLQLDVGHLGRGSYGESLARFPTDESRKFNQIDALQRNLREGSFRRTNALTTWNPPYSMGDEAQGFPRQVAVAPCHGNFVTFTVFEDKGDKFLEMTVMCRSSDAPVGLPMNIVQWAALGMMVSYLFDYRFDKYTVYLSNPHIYDIQIESATELIKREPARFPTVQLLPDRKVGRIQDFRKEDFLLEDYYPHAKMVIPTPI